MLYCYFGIDELTVSQCICCNVAFSPIFMFIIEQVAIVTGFRCIWHWQPVDILYCYLMQSRSKRLYNILIFL